MLLFLAPSKVSAHSTYNFQTVSEGQVDEALLRLVPVRFLNSHPLYFLIWAKENVTRFFKPSAARKAEFDTIVAGKKLKESYLLLKEGDVKNSGRTLASYGKRLDKMVDGLERARSQNQDVSSLVDLMAENLRVHETMFFAIQKEWELMEDDYNFDSDFAGAVSSHARAVLAIDNVKPGLRDRFTTVGKEATQEANPAPYPTPYVQEATPSVKPKRVIL
ncbi:hypothetical protein HYZ70_00305 [Candidatus Curtissbacteria bacterium]|nr:hypothetical protein [Candidatus Curtissbacteria bacterium]